MSEIALTPYLPVPETNGEEWDRLEQASALDALVELVLHGEYQGINSEKRLRTGLELRAAAASVFEVDPFRFIQLEHHQKYSLYFDRISSAGRIFELQ